MQSKFEQLLDYLVNEETEKANELFHQIVVEKSRGIYENLIAEEEKDEEEDEDKKSEKEVEENFGMSDESVLEIGGDPADDLVGDVEFGDDEGAEDDMGGDDMGDMGGDDMGATDDEQDERIDDLEDALADLKAEFERLMSDVDTDGDGDHDMDDHGEEGGEEGDEEGDEEEGEDDDMLREYTEKVGGATYDKFAKGGDNGANTKSVVAGENRMGGVTPKLGQGDEKGGVKGGLVNPSPKDMNTGNVNVKGGTNAKQFYSKDGKGHGAEKSGSGESGANTKSPLAPSHNK